ncbi:hypothetical protein [Vibrio sp. CAU 1672]|uniref:hypothetical protein n=1 Tax=Vibrio sp. CAU 1672 TaxID=3032594 RepID=UPI0023DA4614|nr:hypothetical protein [Vibrio sp. CAU 1672]MDF2152974.1 hypothetical protein [Vibrio sp. CAU 1672]
MSTGELSQMGNAQVFLAECNGKQVIEVANLLVSRQKPQTSRYLEWFRRTLPKWQTRLNAHSKN